MQGVYGIDITEFKKGISIAEVVMRDPSVKLQKKGSNFVGHCPFHNDTHASLTVYDAKGIYKCYACGEGGDVISYVSKRKGLSFKDSIEVLGGDFELEMVDRHEEITSPKYECVMPVPRVFTPPSFMHYKFGLPKAVWEYRSLDGVYGYACRFEWLDDKKSRVVKDVLPYCVVRRGQSYRWEYKGFMTDFGTPLYGLHRLEEDKEKVSTVIVVEGEKTADALQKVLPHVIVVSWMGGANRVSRADWQILRGWKGAVIGFPDNDWQGWSAMVHVSKMIGRDMRMIASPSDAPKGWDFADCDWGISETRLWCRENMVWANEVNGVYDFGDGGLVSTEWGWRLMPWKKELN